MEDLTGREFGPYRIVAPLGEGGMAAVYKAYQANMDRDVALKVLPRHFASDPQFVARFEQEAKVLAKLRHPHILPVHDYGQVDGYTYLVMPFIESGALINLLRAEPLPLNKIERFIRQVGDALDYAHSEGIIHRDVKPSNVLVDERENCMLVDFGIAKIVEGTANLTQTGGMLGTPAYMAPEQGRGKAADHRIDIYALGVILYEMATGRVPFKAETPIAVLVKHINDPLSPPRQVNPDLPPAVEKVILKAMAKNPDDRFATAGEMVAALSAAVAEAPAPDPMVGDRTVASREELTAVAAPQEKTANVAGAARSGGLSRYAWVVGAVGLGAIILILVACGVLFLNLSGTFQTAEATVDSPAQELESGGITATIPTPVAKSSDQNEQTETSDDLPAETDPQPTTPPAQAAPTETPPPQPTATPAQAVPTEPPSPQPTATRAPSNLPARTVLSFGE